MAKSLLIPAAVFALAAAVLLQRAGQVGYNTDEGQKIAAAQYFEVVFLDRVFAGPPWEETYWTLTQPPVVRYILGAAIWLSGNPIPRTNLEHRVDEVRGPDRDKYWDPRTYRNERRLAEERQVERPRAVVLAAARVPMALFGAGAVALLFLLGRALAGTLAGLVASLGLLVAPIALTLLPRAIAESPLLFFILLGLYFGVRAAGEATDMAAFATASSQCHPERSEGSPADRQCGAGQQEILRSAQDDNTGAQDDNRRTRNGLGVTSSLGLGLLAGVATGLGAATKLPAVLGLVALGGFAVWSLTVRPWTPPAAVARSWRWSALAAVVGLAVFVLVNPFLWPDPVGRTSAMLLFRRQELAGQRFLNPEDAVPDDLVARASLLVERSFVLEAPLARRTGLPLDAVLAAAGVAALGHRALRARRRSPLRGPGLIGPEAFTLIWIAAFLAGTAPNLSLDWQRYYLPTVALGLLLAGVGADAIVRLALRRWGDSFGTAPARGPLTPAGEY